MITYNNLYNNKNMKVIASLDGVKVFEHTKDLSIHSPQEAINAYFASEMNLRKRQVLITLEGNAFTISPGKMQWMAGNIKMSADVKGLGNLIGKAFSASVTKESTIKPKYQGTGVMMLEPTYRHLLLERVEEWDGLVLDDGLFLACDSKIQQKITARSNLSSAVLGNEGLFNLCLVGEGIAVLESPVPRDELIEVNLTNDMIRIDGNMAIAWSKSLEFTVEKSGKSLIGSAVSGEGLVNVFRGTGKILMAPMI